MSLPKTIAGKIGLIESTDYGIESYQSSDGTRILDADPSQSALDDGPPTTSGYASTVIEETVENVYIQGTNITIEPEETVQRVASPWSVRGEWAMAENTITEGGGVFPFTLLSAVTNKRCEAVNIEVDNLREAWQDDGVLSDTWLAASSIDGTVMAYGDASSESEASDIGLGFERAWEGFMLRGVIYQSGYLAVYEDIDEATFLRFIDEEVGDFAYVPDDDDDDTTQTSL